VPFVFLDEIDADVGGDYLFRYLLAAMADGKFYHGGMSNYLGKAVLVFAGSKAFVPKETRENEKSNNNSGKGKDSANKGKKALDYKAWKAHQMNTLDESLKESDILKIQDFFDRIDIHIFIPSNKTELSDSKLELETLAISLALIQKHFNNVTRVERAAAHALFILLQKVRTRRQAESAVFLSETPTDETFKFQHLPDSIQERLRPFVQDQLGIYYSIE
jgi:hypothetical protein